MFSKEAGDTIVEVVLAFAIFALIAIGAFMIMNRGVVMVDNSLETTLVREQIDAQAAILRYAVDTDSAAWQDIRNHLGTADQATGKLAACPSAAQLPPSAFIGNLSETGQVVYTPMSNAGTVFSPATTHSQFTFRGVPASSGFWVVPVPVQGSSDTFDMYIRACWQPIGTERAETLGTIVRLYDPPELIVTTPPTPQVCNALDSYSNNLIANGNFSISAGNGPGVSPAAGFESDLPNRGPNVYPDDDGLNGATKIYTGGFSLQSGNHYYGPAAYPDAMYAQVFPGDPSRGVPPSNTYFYSNPNQRVSQPPGTVDTFSGVLWRQNITGLQPNTTYDFSGYFDNVLRPTTPGAEPRIQLRANGDPLMDAISIPRLPDEYQRISLVFTTGSSQTSVTLDIYDYANDINGDDFAMTALALRRCI